MENTLRELKQLQKDMQEKAVKKDASIIMDVFRLDEIIKELEDANIQ